ncbi:MAG: hypothetical protein ACD_37C00174G0001 [uncultured bacterium]|nr:MAG: hypothetical protein ACD_37C00174G0001 [uncultured bacterium]
MLRSIEANIISAITFKHPILDIGIGDGGISRFLFSKKLRIDVGIDIDEQGLQKARETRIYKKVLQADAQKMPFKDACFNTVVSNSTFEHIEDDLKAVREVSRVLRKNGLFFMTVPNPFLEKTVLSIEGNSKKAKLALNKFNTRLQHFHYRSLMEWEKIFKKKNMRVIYYKYYYPEEITKVWYGLMKFSIRKIRNREVWSYIAHSKFNRIIPKQLVVNVLKNMILKKPYFLGLPPKADKGSMLFLIAQKSA